jgi:lipoprotein signal peptidase
MPTRKPISFALWFAVTLLLALIDQAAKAVVRAYLLPGDRLPLLGGFFSLTFSQNYRGFSWFVPGLPALANPLFFIVRLVILLLAFSVYRFYTQTVRSSRWTGLAVLGISASVLGNLVDDILMPFTTDFLQVFNSPAANLADLFGYFGLSALCVEFIAWFRLRKPKWRGFRHFLVERVCMWQDFYKFLKHLGQGGTDDQV